MLAVFFVLECSNGYLLMVIPDLYIKISIWMLGAELKERYNRFFMKKKKYLYKLLKTYLHTWI